MDGRDIHVRLFSFVKRPNKQNNSEIPVSTVSFQSLTNTIYDWSATNDLTGQPAIPLRFESEASGKRLRMWVHLVQRDATTFSKLNIHLQASDKQTKKEQQTGCEPF